MKLLTGLAFAVVLIAIAIYSAVIWHRDQSGESQNEN